MAYSSGTLFAVDIACGVVGTFGGLFFLWGLLNRPENSLKGFLNSIAIGMLFVLDYHALDFALSPLTISSSRQEAGLVFFLFGVGVGVLSYLTERLIMLVAEKSNNDDVVMFALGAQLIVTTVVLLGFWLLLFNSVVNEIARRADMEVAYIYTVVWMDLLASAVSLSAPILEKFAKSRVVAIGVVLIIVSVLGFAVVNVIG